MHGPMPDFWILKLLKFRLVRKIPENLSLTIFSHYVTKFEKNRPLTKKWSLNGLFIDLVQNDEKKLRLCTLIAN